MTSRLSSLLVQDGLVSAKRMADAFQRQVIYGGTLDTNLLEMRVVEEDVLLTYLGRSSGLPTQPAGFSAMGAPAPDLLRIFPRDLAERFRAIPCRPLEEGVLRVLVADPVEPQDMEALAQNVRQRIEPWISTEFRVVEAMEAVYGEPMPPRFQRLLSRSKQAHEQKGLPPPRLIDPVPRFGNLHDFRLEATAPGSLAGMVLPIAESPAALAKAAELTSPPRLPRPVAFEDEATVVTAQPTSQPTEVQPADVIEATPIEAPVEATSEMPVEQGPARREPEAQAPASQESVPEPISEESAPVVPVKAPAPVEAAPAQVQEAAPAAAPVEAAPAQVQEMAPQVEEPATQARPAAPATKPAAQQQPAGGGKRGKRNKRRGESHHAPATAPVITRPVITPPSAKAPEQKAPEQKAPEQRAPEQRKGPPPAPAPTRAPAVTARGSEPTVVVTDLPSEVHETQRQVQAPVSQLPQVSGVPPHMTSEHTPLPAPFPSSDLSAPHQSLGAAGPRTQGDESVPVPIDSGRLGEQIVIGRPSQPPRESPRVAVSLSEPRPTALSFEAARELIAAAQERDMIFEALCRAMRSRVAFAAVFTVHGDVAFGRTALLDGWLDRQALGKIAIPLDRPSAFRIAVKGRSPYAGRLGDQPAAGEALTAMGRKAPLIGAVLPVLVRGRPLALLYLDDEGRELPAGLLEDLRSVMAEVSQAFQRLVLRSRAGFGGAQVEEGRRGQVQDEMIAPTTSAWRKPEPREKDRDKRPTLARFSAHGEVSTPPRVVEVRDAAPPPAPAPVKDEAPRPERRAPEAAAPRESTESPTTKLRPEGARRITAENRPVDRPGDRPGDRPVDRPGDREVRTPSGPLPQVERPRRPESGKESRPEISAPRIEARPQAPSLADLVAKAATSDEKAVEQLLAGGEQAARALVMALPGPLKSRERQALGDPIGEPVYLRGPLLGLVPRMGQAAVQPLLERLDNPVTPPDIRYYVALCFSELPVTAAIAPLGRRLFDSDDAVRMAAVTALRSCPPVEAMRELLETLRSDLLGPDPRRQQHAVEALGELRDVQAVPRLIQILSSADLLLVAASARALQTITKQDFGRSRWRWRRWWARHQTEPRLQWMLSALSHESSTVRASAQDELRNLCGDVVGYRFDLPRRDRDAACRRWVRWWQGRGYSVYVP